MHTAAVLLAGGVGARLWPRSREHKPKQFLRIIGEQTLLQQAFDRVRRSFSVEDIFVVTNISTVELTREQLPELPAANILAEPFGRNTATAIALALTVIPSRYGIVLPHGGVSSAIMGHSDMHRTTLPEPAMMMDMALAFFPSDHVIGNVPDFVYTISLCASMVSSMEGIILLGVPPVRPETGFGYIQAEEHTSLTLDVSTETTYTLRRITSFAEKPDIETAIRFVNAGDFLWNTGIFFARASSLHEALEEYLPDHANLFRLLAKHVGKDSFAATLDSVYRQVRSVSIDYGIMEKARNTYVIEGAFDWNDVGTWDAVYQLSSKDSANNVFESDALAFDAEDNFVSAKKLVALVGVDDLVVVESDDAIVICRRGQSQNVKEVVDFMRRRQIRDFL
jgi:mannose-1-phosphate guanylyltransferase